MEETTNSTSKEQTPEKKKKKFGWLGKLLIFIVMLAVSIAGYRVNFIDLGHQFFMRIFSVAFPQEEQPQLPMSSEEPFASETSAPTELPTEIGKDSGMDEISEIQEDNIPGQTVSDQADAGAGEEK